MRVQDLVGTTVCDTYVVEGVLGAGTMGAVLLVRHVRLPRLFAMKVLHDERGEHAEVFARFRREAEIASALGHPHIVSVVDWNRLPDGTPFLIMEYLRGEDLGRRMERSGPLPLPMVMELVRQVGSALAAAHKNGIVHRDLKPQNIFLCKEDRGDEEVEVAKVLDFGISKILGDPGANTGALRVMGTPLYMAPEQAMGFAANVDGRADQFALAAIIYHAISGRRPFDGGSVIEIALKVMNEAPVPLRQVCPEAPLHVEQAVMQALSKERERRFATIGDFVRALGIHRQPTGAALAPVHVEAEPPPPVPDELGDTGLVRGGASGAAAQGMQAPTPQERPVLGLFLVAVVFGVMSWGATRAIGHALFPLPVVATSVPPVAPPPPPPRPEVRPPAVPKVRLRFAVTPPAAEIYLDGKRIETQIEVPRSEIGLRLEIRAHGYAPHAELVVPSSDQRIIVHLARRRVGGVAPQGPANPTVSSPF